MSVRGVDFVLHNVVGKEYFEGGSDRQERHSVQYSFVRKPVQDYWSYECCKGNRVAYLFLHQLLGAVLPLQRSIFQAHIASCIGSYKSHQSRYYSPFDCVLIVFVPDV